MKPLKKFTFFYLLTSLLYTVSSFAEGVSVRGGGDEIGLEFIKAAQDSIKNIRDRYPDIARKFNTAIVDSLLAESKIIIVEEPLFVPADNGQQASVAVNEPSSKTIWIHRQRWKAISSIHIREAIALHEILSLRKLEHTGRYPISSAYLGKFQEQNDESVFLSGRNFSDPTLWRNTRISCDETIKKWNPNTNEYELRTTSYLEARVIWKIGKREYTLSYLFGSEPMGGWMGKHVISQSIRTLDTTSEKDKTIHKYKYRDLLIDQDYGFVITELADRKYMDLIKTQEDGKTLLWHYKNKKKGELYSSTKEKRLSDGSKRIVTHYSSLSTRWNQEKVKDSKTSDCIYRNLSDKTWLNLTDNKLIALEVEKISARAIRYSEAHKEYWAAGLDATFFSSLKELKAQRQKFNKLWTKIFEDRWEQVNQNWEKHLKKNGPIPFKNDPFGN